MSIAKSITAGLLFVAVLAQVWLLQFDYYIHVGTSYAIYNDPRPPRPAVLQFIKPTGIDFPCIRNVQTYAQSGEVVVGTTDRGFYLADAAGTITEYADLAVWQAACNARGASEATARLISVSRYRDRAILLVQVGIAVVVLIAFLLHVCARYIRRPSPPTLVPDSVP